MASNSKLWKSIPPQSRLSLVNGRISNIENQLYNFHLTELEGNDVDKEQIAKLTNSLEALITERDSVQAEVDAEAAKNAAENQPPTPPTV